jgi:RNA polymerase sigma-70 factor (ECF subfamily)
MSSEEKLIQQCICGDRFAQKQLYEQYSPLFFAMCMRYMPNREDAEDVLVMGFTTIFTKLDTFKNEGNFEGWMRRIIINTAITSLRSNSKHYEMKKKEEELDKGIRASEDTIYAQINAKDILLQIQNMPTGCRTIFNLYSIEGYSYDEIAKMLQINIGTVRSQLAKARKKLQKKLQGFR